MNTEKEPPQSKRVDMGSACSNVRLNDIHVRAPRGLEITHAEPSTTPAADEHLQIEVRHIVRGTEWSSSSDDGDQQGEDASCGMNLQDDAFEDAAPLPIRRFMVPATKQLAQGMKSFHERLSQSDSESERQPGMLSDTAATERTHRSRCRQVGRANPSSFTSVLSHATNPFPHAAVHWAAMSLHASDSSEQRSMASSWTLRGDRSPPACNLTVAPPLWMNHDASMSTSGATARGTST